MAKHPKPSTKATARPVEAAPAQPETKDLERLKKFFVENRYYVFLGLIVAGVIVGVYFWNKSQEETKAKQIARDLDSRRKTPLGHEDDVQPENMALDTVAANGGRFFETDLAKEDAEELGRIASRSEGTAMEPWARYHLANHFYAAGEYAKAIAEYETFVGRFSEKDKEHVLLTYVKKDLARAKAEKDYAASKPAAPVAASSEGGRRLRVETTAGSFVVELAARDAGDLATNFEGLVRSDYYDGLSFYESDRVSFGAEGGSNVPFAIGTGSPWGERAGGPGYTQPRSNLATAVEEGTVLVDNEKDEASGGRIWFVREKSVEDPGELDEILEQSGVPEADRTTGKQLAYYESLGYYLYQNRELMEQYQQLVQNASPEAREVQKTIRDWMERKGDYTTFVEKVDAWRAARSKMIEGKYSVLGKVVEGIDILRKLDPGEDFVLRIEPAPTKTPASAASN